MGVQFPGVSSPDYSAYIHLSRYSRWLDTEKRRERWDETVTRYCDFWKKRFPEAFPYQKIHRAILNLDVMPSMRCMMTAGTALERDEMAGFNCSALPIDHIRAFDEVLYVLMCGTGVGFSVEKRFVSKLPIVGFRIENENPVFADQLEHAHYTIVVADSKIGWANAFHELLTFLYSGYIPTWDLSRIRPAGAPLKTMGGRASGPAPLDQLFVFATSLFSKACGRKLTSIEVHDLVCKIADIVVVGGVRRSALISLSDLGDADMRDSKSGLWYDEPAKGIVRNGHRALANNSAVYEERPTMNRFFDEWSALFKSGSGERGIFNREALREKLAERGKRNLDHVFLTNPCVTGDTVIATVEGPRTFASLAEAGVDVQVFAWHPETKLPVVRWMRRPHRTHTNAQLLEVEFDSGLKLRLTPDHSLFTFRGAKVKAQNLRIGQSVRAFSISQHRDGQYRAHAWDAETNSARHQWVHRMVWENAHGSIPDTDIIHHKDENTNNNALSNLEKMTAVEHNVVHYPKRFANGFDGTCANHKVVAIRTAEPEDVFNGCVDDAHTYIIVDPVAVAGVLSGIVSANCGEIVLRPYGLCNLSEVIVRSGDDEKELKRKTEIATIIGTFQSTLTNFRYVRDIWRKNAEEERLLGVSMTGIMDNPLLGVCAVALTERLKNLRVHTEKVNAHWAKELGISASLAITTVKPSGTVSQLVDSASGIHPRHARYYIRRAKTDNADPLGTFMKTTGFPHEDSAYKPGIDTVFTFPMKAPENAVLRSGVTAIEQLEHYKIFRSAWCDHNPSITISVRESEWMEVGAWVYKNFNYVGGVSFLPFADHIYVQAPFEEIDETAYKDLLQKMPIDVDWGILTEENGEAVTGTRDLSCVSGACEVSL